VVDRAELRAELEATREAFLALLERTTPEAWSRPSRNPAWTVGALLWHIASGVGTTMPNARAAMAGRDMPVSQAEADRMNRAFVAKHAPAATPESVRALYEANHAETLRGLAELPEDAWTGTARLYGGTLWSVEECFRYVAGHFAEHAADVEPARR
jgi:hypothetical protein